MFTQKETLYTCLKECLESNIKVTLETDHDWTIVLIGDNKTVKSFKGTDPLTAYRVNLYRYTTDRKLRLLAKLVKQGVKLKNIARILLLNYSYARSVYLKLKETEILNKI